MQQNGTCFAEAVLYLGWRHSRAVPQEDVKLLLAASVTQSCCLSLFNVICKLNKAHNQFLIMKFALRNSVLDIVCIKIISTDY